METNDNNQVTRKQFLKLLLAGGTATAAASLFPGKWVKPLVKVGVLPAHAQASLLGLTIDNFSLDQEMGSIPGKGAGLAKTVKLSSLQQSSLHFLGSFSYFDEGSGVTSAATLQLFVDGDIYLNGNSIASLGGSVLGSMNGLATFYVDLPESIWNGVCSYQPNASLTMTVSPPLRSSNTVITNTIRVCP